MRSRPALLSVTMLLAGAGSVCAQVTTRLSLSSLGVEGNGDSDGSAISADGRFVAFLSHASNLVPGDTNGGYDVFVRDRLLGTTERVSVDSLGGQANQPSDMVAISADGRFVAFYSAATNLVLGDTNNSRDAFVHDRLTGLTERVSVNSAGAEGNQSSGYPGGQRLAISADGRFVAFDSLAFNLVSGDTNAVTDIFVRDRLLATTERVSVDSNGAQADLDSHWSSISGDGRFVAFWSNATNLATGDTNGASDVFVRDRVSGTTQRASVSTGGGQADGGSGAPQLSSSGRYVAFYSNATTLVGGDTNGVSDIFWRDLQTGVTARVSLAAGGAQANSYSFTPAISADGRYVGFWSYASNLVSGDTNAKADVFLSDLQYGTIERLSVDSAGNQGNGDSESPSVSGDGRFVCYDGSASNLVTGDLNGSLDVFVDDRLASGFTSLCDPGLSGVIACPCANPPAGTGRGCDNSSSSGGAVLSASGIAYLSIDSLVFATSGEKPTALSIVLQGTSVNPAGVAFGQGVRCASGTLKRLYAKTAISGGITAPDAGAGDPAVSIRSAQLGDPIQPGETRSYLVYYRDPIVLGGCAAASAFNCTQTGSVAWWP
jgi:hypothetical protein